MKSFSSMVHRGRILPLAFGIFFLALCLSAHAQQIVRIPGDHANLQQAIAAVPNGGVIEFAAGTYSAPTGGFTIYDLPTPKAFTVRAAAGAAVTLTGNGSTDILRFSPSNFSTARPVTFERITFANGFSKDAFIGGAMTLVHCEVNFVNCTFQNNAANTPLTGGGAQWIDSSIVSFQGCIWTGNNSPNYGAGMSASNSRVYIRDCRFSGNRANLPNHKNNSAGGAIFLSSAPSGVPFTRETVRIANCTFENNQAGLAGGAIYAIAGYQNPADVPTIDLIVSNSLFMGNQAVNDPSVPSVAFAPNVGGAAHLEDQITARFQNCRFISNMARQGGAISSYRGTTDFQGCVFRGNQALGTGSAEGIGGTIFAVSSDNNDSSTDFGKINRPSAVLTMSDCLVQGMPGVISGREGGGIFAAGDINAPAVPGSPDFNRALVQLNRVVLADCSVAAAAGTPGTGGGLKGDFMLLTMDNSIVQNCSAADHGGGLNFGRFCSVTITNSTLAYNGAGALGGAIAMFGGTLNLSASNLIGNRITGAGSGAAITTSPAMAGLIQNCVISSNTGGATIYDGDSASSPFNQLQYASNQIYPGDATTFFSDVVGPQTVAQLNTLELTRSDRTTTKKAPAPNTVPAGPPAVGALLILPPAVLNSGGPGEAMPIAPVLGYASSGGTPVLDGSAQRLPAAVVGPVSGSAHILVVGGSTYSTTPPPGVAVNISTRLALGTGEQVLIGGFIIQGPLPKTVIIRGTGPSLGGIAGTLRDPFLSLNDARSTLATNDNWRTTLVGGIISSNQSIDIMATGIPPSNDLESAIVATLNPGSYTAVLRGADGGAGVGLMEIYDLDGIQLSRLANISTRGVVQTGENVMIGGFIIQGGINNTTVIIRALGPSLTAFGISGALPDPILEAHDANGAVITNDDWGQGPNAGEIQAKGLAPGNPAESALLLSGAPPGNYTAIVRGKTTTGVGLVEVYQLQ